MVKKLGSIGSALAVLAAMIAPAAANATPVLTSGGVKVPVGTAIKGTANSTNLRLTSETGLGMLECESINLNGEVTENSGTSIKGVGTEGSTTSGCSFEGAEQVDMGQIAILDVASNKVEGETGTGTFHVSYEYGTPGGGTCKFSNAGKAAGVFHYVIGTDILHIKSTNITSTACGESFLEGTVALETTDGTPVTAS